MAKPSARPRGAAVEVVADHEDEAEEVPDGPGGEHTVTATQDVALPLCDVVKVLPERVLEVPKLESQLVVGYAQQQEDELLCVVPDVVLVNGLLVLGMPQKLNLLMRGHIEQQELHLLLGQLCEVQ